MRAFTSFISISWLFLLLLLTSGWRTFSEGTVYVSSNTSVVSTEVVTPRSGDAVISWVENPKFNVEVDYPLSGDNVAVWVSNPKFNVFGDKRQVFFANIRMIDDFIFHHSHMSS